jgi:cobalt-zinc-cadmium efflux system outer membrane protein
VQLVLQERSASFLESYRTARALADRYRVQLLPRAQRAYQLIYERYGLMQASYPQVLASKETLYRLEADYITSLGRMWSSSVALENFLLTDGLEAPSRPSEMDRPVREINAPSFMGAIGPEK